MRGYRIEAQEIAAQLSRLPHIQNAAVVLQNDRTLAAYIVSDQPVDPAGLRRALMEQLPVPVVPSVYIAVDALPLTANGKLDSRPAAAADAIPANGEHRRCVLRSALAARSAANALKAAGSAAGQRLFRFRRRFPDRDGIVKLIEEKFQVRLKTADLYHLRTAAAIGEVLDGGQSAVEPQLQPAPRQAFYPLSFQQKAILADLLADPENDAYHMPGLFTLPADLDLDRLRQALGQLVQEEELLRTGFVLDGGEIKMQIHQTVSFHVESIEAGTRLGSAALIRR